MWDRLKQLAWWYWLVQLDLCPHCHVHCIWCLFPSPYPGKDLVNHKSMDWKTEKTFVIGQLSNAVQLNSFHGMHAAPKYFPYPDWEPFQAYMLVWRVTRLLHGQAGELVLIKFRAFLHPCCLSCFLSCLIPCSFTCILSCLVPCHLSVIHSCLVPCCFLAYVNSCWRTKNSIDF